MDASQPLFYEDMVPGGVIVSGAHVVERDEMVSFARVWDPLPIHVDEEAGRRSFGGLTAPGIFMLAVKQRLIHSLPRHEVIASLGYDEVRFHVPLRPGDVVHLREEFVGRRESATKPDRGVVTLKFTLINQKSEAVMSHLDTILVRKRSFSTAPDRGRVKG